MTGLSAVRRRMALARAGSDATSDAGFTLIEVIVSFVLFAIVAGGATTGIVSALQASHSSQQRTDAADAAAQDLAQDIAAYRAGTVPGNFSYTAGVSNEQFTVTRTVTFVGSATACAPGASFHVHVDVKQQQTQKFLAQSDTVIAC